jgi:hypothetical protein
MRLRILMSSDNDGADRMRGYKFIKKNTDRGVLVEMWQDDPNEKDPKNQWKLIKSEIQKEKKIWNPPSDHQETIRDDLGLFQMLNNLDKVQEKMKKGQKEVYQDGWSIAPIDHKIDHDKIPNKSKEENPFEWKWKSLREIPDEEEEKEDIV